MTYELKIERLFDAPPEVVFDTLVDPDAQEEVFNDQVEGWKLWEFEIDLRVGGTWTIVYGREDEQGEPDRITIARHVKIIGPHTQRDLLADMRAQTVGLAGWDFDL